MQRELWPFHMHLYGVLMQQRKESRLCSCIAGLGSCHHELFMCVCTQASCGKVLSFTANQTHAQKALTLADVLIWLPHTAAYNSRHCSCIAGLGLVVFSGTHVRLCSGQLRHHTAFTVNQTYAQSAMTLTDAVLWPAGVAAHNNRHCSCIAGLGLWRFELVMCKMY